MARKKKWLAIAGTVVFVIAVLAVVAYIKFYKVSTATLGKPISLNNVQTKLKYEGAYNDPLYLTSEKTGSDAPYDQLVTHMDRNGIKTIIAYFGIEADNRAFAVTNVNDMVATIKQYPGRFVPFYSPGFGSEEAAGMVGNELAGIYKDGLEYSQQAVQGNFIRGIGEVEAQVWQTSLQSPEAQQLFDFASENKLSVMLHTNPRQNDQLEALLANYPDTTFLLHLFTNDFEHNRTAVVDMMKRYKNLVFTIDADHMMFDASSQPPIGLLYKYQNEDSAAAAKKFSQDYDAKFDVLLNKAVERYRPIIEAAPDRVTIGTEMSTDYTYETAVYDRTIKFIRYFIARQNPNIQKDLASSNAERIFGQGVVLQ